ncbi:TRAP transporter solute receptor, TAXI family precursor [Halomonas citrativorans]|uniref:TRAP transporter solute receptor, TAXI family n=1 Tax=Halomonas citrativorans TaxID=2742612 RepID=A0A1R4I271_9GAMM|nr:TAXI family TRAP transporter solute-binding subunit [Halomonas citrativorans]SJN13900.1 TRAP transporter solute receptor, TAXI family precursor [Halomonas citrativorans]
MKNLRNTALATILAAVPMSAWAQDATIRIISQDPGTGWYAYGSAVGEIIDRSEGEFNLNADVLPRGGGMVNPLAVGQGSADIGFATANAALWARDGIGEEFEGRSAENLRTLVGGLQAAYTTITARRAYVERTGLTTFDDMVNAENPPRFVLKPTGSQVPILADHMFEALGTSLEEMRDRGAINQISTAQIAQMMRDGTADVYIENAPLGQATMQELALTTDVVLVPMSDNVLDHMVEVGVPRIALPEGSYPKMDGDYASSNTPTILIVSTDLDDDVAYQITAAMVEARDQLAESFPPLAGWDPQAGAQPDQSVLELHPGAARYYRERGWIE